MLAALRERGIRPDVIVGTSVGALNGAWLAGHPDAPIDDLAKVWTSLHRSDVFATDPRRGLLALAGRGRSLFDADALRSLIERNVTFARLEDAPTPLHVVAVEVLTGRDVLLSSGPAVDSVLASAALPAIFDPVEIDGVPYMDGGVGNNTPISHAVALGVDKVWVLSAGHACALTEPPNSRSEELIERAYNASTRWLDEDHPPFGQARFMGPHDHVPRESTAGTTSPRPAE